MKKKQMPDTLVADIVRCFENTNSSETAAMLSVSMVTMFREGKLSDSMDFSFIKTN